MIHRIYSDYPEFKELNFRQGLNILLAEKTPGAKETQTYNSSGKTSVIEIIHFLTGARKDDQRLIFRNPKLREHNFGLNFDLGGQKISVERNATDEDINNIYIIENETNDWPITPNEKKQTGEIYLHLNEWLQVLGYFMFDLSVKKKKDSYAPSFRSLFSYFVRREIDGAFNHPISHSKMQQNWDQQVALSYLLGIDWAISQSWQKIRDREGGLKKLKKVTREGTFNHIIGTAADIRRNIAVSKRNVQQLRETLTNFRVLPEYEVLEKEASQLTVTIGNLSDEDTLDEQLIKTLQESVDSETPPAYADIQEVYKEASIVLPELIKRRFSEVAEFHESVIKNRRSYLDGEIESAKNRISSRRLHKQKLDLRRAEIMAILNSHGALDHFRKLQSELNKRERELEAFQQQLDIAEKLEGAKTELEIERRKLLLRLQQDMKEQSENIDEAILAFEEISSALFENPGVFTMSESKNGPIFDVKLSGDKGAAIRRMAIYCFDMMLMQLCCTRGIGPGFLVHDSHLFEGVDPRQVSAALVIGSETAEKFGFQYIVTLNQHELPQSYHPDFNIDDYILPVRLTDKTEDGGLFGFRFE